MRVRTLIVSLLVLVGCSTTPRPIVSVPESLETATPIEVKRHWSGLGARPMRFGEWQVNAFDRKGFPGSRSWAVGPEDAKYTQSRGWAAYSFRLTPNAGDEWACDCRFKKQSHGVRLGKPGNTLGVTLSYNDSLRCNLWREGDAEPWKLVIYGSLWIGGEGYSGILAHGSRTFNLEPSHEIMNLGSLPGSPLGYVFVRDGEEIAATELIRPGFVRIDDAAGDDRDVIATAAAALLLQPAL